MRTGMLSVWDGVQSKEVPAVSLRCSFKSGLPMNPGQPIKLGAQNNNN